MAHLVEFFGTVSSVFAETTPHFEFLLIQDLALYLRYKVVSRVAWMI